MDFLSRLQRKLPDTDKDRYDVAFEQGVSQARSGLLFGGLLVGALTGAAAMYLLDPARGADRRAKLASRASGLRDEIARTATGKGEDLQNRARGAAADHGAKPEGAEPKRSKAQRNGAHAQTDSGSKREAASTTAD
jgi:gas vesicle protein